MILPLGRVLINAQIAALRAQKNGQLEAEKRACFIDLAIIVDQAHNDL